MVAGHFFLFPTLVTFYNDYSLSTTNPLADYNFGIAGRYKRGWSILGYSVSPDVGASWEYHGQISPPQEGGWATIGGDPSMAVDPNSGTIYVVGLAVSDDAWNTVAVNDMSDTYPLVLSDSFCVAASTNGGIDFPIVKCQAINSAPGGADRTAIAIDGFGRVWVGISRLSDPGDATTGFVTAYHTNGASLGSGFVEAPPPIATIRSPSLHRDLLGNVWLGSLERPGAMLGTIVPGVWVQKFDIGANKWNKVKDIAQGCGLSISSDQQVPINPGSNSFFLRNAHTYDFDVGLADESFPGAGSGEVLRAAFELTRDDARRYVQVVEYDTSTLATCRSEPTLCSTVNDAGAQFMPSLQYVNRDGTPWWWLVYLTTRAVVNPSGPYVYPEAIRPNSVGALFPALTLPAMLAPPDWSECAGKENYWGDYFALTQIKDMQGLWWGVSTFTSSRPNVAACDGGKPQHIASNRW